MVRAKVFPILVDNETGDEVPFDTQNPHEDVDFLELPIVDEHIIWRGSLDLERFQVIRIEHFPMYPDRKDDLVFREHPAVHITAKWICRA